MKLKLLIIFISFGQVSFGQTIQKDLYSYVDSVIVNVLKYKPDTVVSNDTVTYVKQKTGLYPSKSSLPTNPEPLILVDVVQTKKEKLKEIDFDDIETIEIMHKSNQEMIAIFGQSAANGLIVITTKDYARKEKRKSKRKN